MQQYLDNCGSVIRIPSHAKHKIIRYKKTVEKFEQEFGRKPTDKDISERMRTNISTVRNLRLYSQSITSLDIPVADDTDTTLSESLQANCDIENDTVDKMYSEYEKNELWGIVARYTTGRENQILKKYYIQNMSMPDIAQNEHVCIQRISDIKIRGLRKLRCGQARKELLEKLDILESGMYRTSIANFKNHGFSSMVEYMAIRKVEIQAEYEKCFENIG